MKPMTILLGALAASACSATPASAASAATGVCTPDGSNDRPIACVNSDRCNDVQEAIKPTVYRLLGGDQWACRP